MNRIMPERRTRKRISVSGEVELIAGGTRIPATLLDISFVGLRCRVAPDALAGLAPPVYAVRLEDLPSLAITGIRHEGDEFTATFDAPEKAGRIVAGFLELFVPPRS